MSTESTTTVEAGRRRAVLTCYDRPLNIIAKCVFVAHEGGGISDAERASAMRYVHRQQLLGFGDRCTIIYFWNGPSYSEAGTRNRTTAHRFANGVETFEELLAEYDRLASVYEDRDFEVAPLPKTGPITE
jgi:hypothetical protein